MDEKQIEKMIALAAKKLDMTPEQLKETARSGNVDGILSKMDGASAEKVRQKSLKENLINKVG